MELGWLPLDKPCKNNKPCRASLLFVQWSEHGTVFPLVQESGFLVSFLGVWILHDRLSGRFPTQYLVWIIDMQTFITIDFSWLNCSKPMVISSVFSGGSVCGRCGILLSLDNKSNGR